jgi:hypothetical protein
MKHVFLILTLVIFSCQSKESATNTLKHELPDHKSRLADFGSQEFDVLTQGGRIKGCKSKR